MTTRAGTANMGRAAFPHSSRRRRVAAREGHARPATFFLFCGRSTTMATKKGMGFKKAQASIAAREGVGEKAAGAILAAATRKASAAAKKANPRLTRVK